MMTPEERKAQAQIITSTPLYAVLHDELERNAIEGLIAAQTEQARIEAQAYVRAARAFRSDCERELRNTGKRRGAPV